jgi:hypothetical protein
MDYAERITGDLRNSHCAATRLVSADRHEYPDPEGTQGPDASARLFFVHRDVARGSQNGASAKVDVAHRIDGKKLTLGDCVASQMSETIEETDDLDAREIGADGCRADHAIRAGRRATADKDCEPTARIHIG